MKISKIIDYILSLLEHIFSSEKEFNPGGVDMKMSHQGISMLTILESKKLKPYDDQTGKTITLWCKGATIGVGHLISKAEWNKYKDGIICDESDALLAQDLKSFENTIRESVKIDIDQQKFDALCMFSFNIGNSGFKRSSALKLINDPDAKTNYESLEDAWKAWNKSQGHVMRGLINRRAKEWLLYEHGTYS